MRARSRRRRAGTNDTEAWLASSNSSGHGTSAFVTGSTKLARVYVANAYFRSTIEQRPKTETRKLAGRELMGTGKSRDRARFYRRGRSELLAQVEIAETS